VRARLVRAAARAATWAVAVLAAPLVAFQQAAAQAVAQVAAQAVPVTAPPKDLDAWVTRALRELGQPGIAVAIVQNGRTVLVRGWGVRRLGEPAPVDERTLFQVASNTKAVTAGALAILVSEGRLRWDDRVIDHLPWFRLGDPYVTRELTVRDLLTHRSGLGLGAGDLLWFHSTYGREEIVRRLRTIQPASSFRSRYAYDNVLYIAAGELVEAVSGRPWDDFVRERIFMPLGMAATQTSVTLHRPGDDVATPHARVDGRMQVVAFDTVDNIGGAGSINSSVAEMAAWVRVQLDSGRVDATRRLWGEREAREMWAPHTIKSIGSPPPALAALRANFSAYGLGWDLRDYRGFKLVTHTGGLAGMLSRVMLVPDRKLGIVVLSNGETPAFDAVAFRLLDHYLGAPPTDWIAGFGAAAAQGQAGDRQVEDSLVRTRNAASKPSLPLARYAGRYTDAWYGDITIAEEEGRLVLRWSASPALTADLEHYQYDTFRARMRVRNVADAFLTFSLRPDGTIERIRTVPVLPSTDFSFHYQDLDFRPVPSRGP
jgi:CubicO group peptidase (beta-lactamase class C family)